MPGIIHIALEIPGFRRIDRLRAIACVDSAGGDRPLAGWQGGLPLRYHVGPGPSRVKVEVTTDAATHGTKAIYNTLGYRRGTDFPDGHRYKKREEQAAT